MSFEDATSVKIASVRIRIMTPTGPKLDFIGASEVRYKRTSLIRLLYKNKMVQVSLYDISILQTAGPCLIYTEVIMLSGSLQLMRLRFAARFLCGEIILNIEIFVSMFRVLDIHLH